MASLPLRPKEQPAVSTAEAKNAAKKNHVKEELMQIAEKLLVYPEDQRPKRRQKLIEIKGNFSPETKEFLRLTQLREEQHRDFMQEVLPGIQEISTDRNKHPCGIHDCSKDELFFFVAPAYFDGGLFGDPKMKQFVDAELKNHYEHEPHHPEYEKYHEDKDCSDQDVVEMAIDRLARNVQYGNGKVNMDVMKKFVPVFPRDNERKQEIYLKYVQKYYPLVEKEFLKMFPNVAEW